MHTLLLYLRERWHLYLLGLVLFATCALVFALYRLPVESVLYAFLLCSIITIGCSFFDFRRYHHRHEHLRGLSNPATMVQDLPEPLSEIERDYQDMLRGLAQDRNRIAVESDARQQDVVDYYALWAHQVKVPLAAMRLLQQSGKGLETAEFAAELTRTDRYTDMALSYVRCDSMAADLRVQRCDLDALVRTAIRRCASEFTLRHLQLIYEPLEREVLTDAKWLVFVIDQVLSNALKYTRAGSITIRMDPVASQTLLIEDTGIGIDAADLPRVFEKGFTGAIGREEHRATGIGMYLSRRIMDGLGHGIAIESRSGEGTCVRLVLDEADIAVD